MDDVISRQAAMKIRFSSGFDHDGILFIPYRDVEEHLKKLPSAQPERLTDDDFETIRIHLNAFKENLCNQRRWKEAEEYQRIIDRFMSFASAQPRKGKWIKISPANIYECSECGKNVMTDDISAYDFCHGCGAEMREGDAE